MNTAALKFTVFYCVAYNQEIILKTESVEIIGCFFLGYENIAFIFEHHIENDTQIPTFIYKLF